MPFFSFFLLLHFLTEMVFPQTVLFYYVLLLLLLQYTSWTVLLHHANSKRHDFRGDLHLSNRPNVADAGIPDLGQRYGSKRGGVGMSCKR